MVVDVRVEYPLLKHYLLGYNAFDSGQRSLFTVENPGTLTLYLAPPPPTLISFSFVCRHTIREPSPSTYKQCNQDEFLRMDRGTISLLFTMLHQFYAPFDELPHAKKVEVIRYLFVPFTLLHRCELTAQCWRADEGRMEERRDWIVTHYGCYVNEEVMKEEFRKTAIDESEQHIRWVEWMSG